MALTVAGLRRLLAKYPDETIVIMSRDGEGNGFSPLNGPTRGLYHGYSPYSGEHYLTEEERQAEDEPDGFPQAPEGAVEAVFLWPMNWPASARYGVPCPGWSTSGMTGPCRTPAGAVAFPGRLTGAQSARYGGGSTHRTREAPMPRLMYSAGEAHRLLTQADHVAGAEPGLAALYATLATEGIDLDACTPDEDVREQLGMPALQPTVGGQGADGQGGRGTDGGGHPSAA